jgi:hypothetical protein
MSPSLGLHSLDRGLIFHRLTDISPMSPSLHRITPDCQILDTGGEPFWNALLMIDRGSLRFHSKSF